MMGTRQKLIDGYEVDFVCARGMYKYLKNNVSVKRFIKRKLSKRRRIENKNINRTILHKEY